ncbi:hypothetical protein MEZE111188_16805 [Mesobacillus zeae]
MASTSGIYQKATPFTVFNAFNLALFSMGVIDESHCDATITEGEGDDKYTRLFINDNKIVGVISLEGVMAATKYKTAIESQVSLVGLDINNMTIRDLFNEIKERLAITA